MDVHKAKTFIGKTFDDSIIPALSRYIEIPNQSPGFDPHWETNGYMDKAIDLLVDWVKKQHVPNLSVEVVRLPSRTPVILMVLESSSDQTVLLYGHMDKQPPVTDQWEKGLGPYTPVIRDGKLYGRGGAR